MTQKIQSFPKHLSRDREARNLVALEAVIQHFGDRAKLARALGLSRSYTSLWREVPIAHVRRLEALTGIPAAEILPDPYPYPEK